MRFFNSKSATTDNAVPPKEEGPAAATDDVAALVKEQRVTMMAVWLGTVASVGGFMFGYVRFVSPLFALPPSE